MSEPTIDFKELEEVTTRALLATTDFVSVIGGIACKRKMSDQARRLGMLLCRMTFGARREGLWVRHQAKLADALHIDEGDCAKAVARLVEWQLLTVEQRDGGRWYQLWPSRLTLQERSLEACAAFAQLEADHRSANQPELVARSRDERRDRGFGDALAEADRERAAVGRFPIGSWEIPNAELGDSQPRVGRLPTPALVTRERGGARGDSQEDRQIAIRCESGANAQGGGSGPSGHRFANDELNWVLGELAVLDPEEWQREGTRPTWINRVRGPCLREIVEAVGEVKHEMRVGARPVRRALGLVFTKARAAARSAGKALRSVFFFAG